MSAIEPRKARELNLWLAAATGLSLVILTYAVFLFGAQERRWSVVAVAPAVVVLYLLINRFIMKRPPAAALIQPDAPITLILAAGVPMIGLLAAVWTALWPGHDFSIAVILVGVLFAMTVESLIPRRG